MQQAGDFLEECSALHRLITGGKVTDLAAVTQFKNWTVEDIVRHLLAWDMAARFTLEDSEQFLRFFAPVPGHMQTGTLREFERGNVKWQGWDLVERWYRNSEETAALYGEADPKKRLKWGGPDLSARSCITSRLMETWSHGQAIYDRFGEEREDGDRIRNIVQMGVQTYAWTYINRHRTPPGPIPNLSLVAPSGAVWRWDNPESLETISGLATEFCQIVTQTRNVADTSVAADGPVGAEWMRVAQCFAGPPCEPPAPGTRSMVRDDRS